MKSLKKRIPVEEGLWTEATAPGEKAQLLGSRCISCEELYFPRKKRGLCIHCQKETLEDIRLNGTGKIASFSVVEQPPAGGFYKGPVPYAYGDVHLSEGVLVQGLFKGNLDELHVGMDVEVVIDKLSEDDEGNDIMTYKFHPKRCNP